MTEQTVNNETLEERIKSFEREKNGLIGDLAKQREKNRALEERLQVIESSLNEPEPPAPQPTEAEIQKFTQDPVAYIRGVASSMIEDRVKPIQNVLTGSLTKEKLNEAMEWIAEEEGISRKEAKKKYDESLAKIVGDHGFQNLDPYDGTLAAYKIMKTEKMESEEKEEERDKRIKSEQPESSRAPSKPSLSKWTTSRIKEVIANGQYEKYREEILTAQNRGLIIKD